MVSRKKFDYSAQYFRKTRDGRTLFYPSGVFGKSLLVKTDEGEKRLRQFIKKHQSFNPAFFGSFGFFQCNNGPPACWIPQPQAPDL